MKIITTILAFGILTVGAIAQTSVSAPIANDKNFFAVSLPAPTTELVTKVTRQTSNGSTGALTFAPGSQFGFDYVAIPPQHGNKHWDTSACVSMPWGVMLLNNHGWSLQSDVLGGFSLNNGALTGGYDVDLAYTFGVNTVSNRVSFVAKLGVAQLFGTDVSPVPGINGSLSINIATR